MTTQPSEFGGVEERLLESALDATQGQFAQAETIIAAQFPSLEAPAQAHLTVAIAQCIAINYLAAATIPNLPKG